MMKKVMCTLTAIGMAAAMAGCGSSGTTAATAAETSTAAETTAAAETEAKAQEEKGESPLQLDGYTMVDLSHPEEASMPADPALKLPETEFFAEIGSDSEYNLETISYCPHTGTHMDAPFHVDSDAGTIDTVDPEVLIGPAAVVKIDIPEEGYGITAEDIKNWEKEHTAIQNGDGVIIHTGHDALWEDFDAYLSAYPHLEEDAAQYLADKNARYVAVEAISPDTDHPVAHKILLGNGTEVVENICNAGDIPTDRCYTIGTFAKSQGNTGVWVRLLAYYKE